MKTCPKVPRSAAALVDMFSRYAQLFRYAFVGILTNSAGFVAYLLMTNFGVGPKTAMGILYFFGAGLGFLGNRQWSFKHKGRVSSSLPMYILSHAIGYCINFLILFCFVDKLGYPHELIQGAAIVVVATFLFLMFKFFVFPSPQTRGEVT
jgi:putative flippase GtrA